VLIFLLIPLVCFSEIYKWRDENGKLHFSDKPSGKSVKINLPTDNVIPVQENLKSEKSKNELDNNLIPVFGSYFLDKSSFSHQPAWVEEKLEYNSYAGKWTTQQFQHYNYWYFNLVRGKTKYECTLTCQGRNNELRAEITPEYNFPAGVERYFRSKLCNSN
jgi:hypothetical protein